MEYSEGKPLDEEALSRILDKVVGTLQDNIVGELFAIRQVLEKIERKTG